MRSGRLCALAANVLRGQKRVSAIGTGLTFYMVSLISMSAVGKDAISFWPYMIRHVFTVEEALHHIFQSGIMFWGGGHLRLPADADPYGSSAIGYSGGTGRATRGCT